DANKPVSYIKKYLAKKLNLQSEDEVEVRMLGMPICPDLPLQHLADLWLHIASSSNSTTEKIVKAEDSAEEFGRRGRKKKETNNIPPPPPPPPLAASGDGGSNNNNNNNNVAQGGVTDHHQEAATTISRGSRVHPIWFTLLASDNQDANKPASYIKKYLAKKLSLQNEDEMEVRMLGMQIRPALPLQHLADMWLHVASSSNSTTDKIVKAGDSTEEFVIVFKYSRCQN
ncbi:Polycomb group RING finger protein 5, partial [Datura stramonium]|nr:Polycomb group RING finger protein 5 [Datura stramonium]